MSIQDRTTEFHALTTSASKKLSRNNPSSAHARLLSNGKGEEKPRRQGGRGEFARKAMDIGRAITDTMGKLERLAMCMFSPPPPFVAVPVVSIFRVLAIVVTTMPEINELAITEFKNDLD